MTAYRMPHVTVATVVERDGRYLVVEERVDAFGPTVINQPAGHWDEGETLFAAAVRETLEETAWDVELEALLGVYEYQPPALDYGFLRFAFAARALRHRPQHALDRGIERALWLTREELDACRARHRSPMVLRCVDDHRAGRRLPLDAIAHLAPRA
ncbi:MAG TPA: NUDIX hydrolase [Dehalococcoidia bacterium]|nr:NUDIX hydrolase [Dehalococcoidia bacterium]